MFGGLTTSNESLNSSIIKELIVLLMGPIVQIIFFILIKYFYINGYLPITTYNNFSIVNNYLLFFNLLPIIPLDGGRILNNILNMFLSFKTSYIISILISFISLPLLFMIDNKLLIIITMIFLIIKLIEEIKNFNYKYSKLILEKILNKESIKDFNKIKRKK